MMGAEPMTDSPFKKREQALQKQLKALPKDNPIIKAAVKKHAAMMGEDEAWKKFSVVEELVSAARKCVTEGDDFMETVGNLADALNALVDKGGKSADNGMDD